MFFIKYIPSFERTMGTMTLCALGYGWYPLTIFGLMAEPAISFSGCRIPICGDMTFTTLFIKPLDPSLFFKAKIIEGVPLLQHPKTITPATKGRTSSKLPMI